MKDKKFCVEITRKCNLKCAHCLRGNSQNISLTKKKIKGMLCHIPKQVDILHLTGGEPLIDNSRHLLTTLRVLEKHIKCKKFELVTNLTLPITNEFFDAISILLKISNSGTIWYSDDDYHRIARREAGVNKQYKENLKKLRRIYRMVRKRRHVNMCAPGKGIIYSGRATKLPIKEYYKPRIKEEQYMTARQYIINDGNNISYKEADKIINKWLDYIDAEIGHYFGREFIKKKLY